MSRIRYIHQFKDLAQQHAGESVLLVQIIDVMVVMESPQRTVMFTLKL